MRDSGASPRHRWQCCCPAHRRRRAAGGGQRAHCRRPACADRV